MMADNKKSVIWDLKPVKALLKNDRAVKTIIFAGVALILLIFMSDILSGTNKESEITNEPAFEEYERRLERKLAGAVSEIDGVGELTVIVTLDSLSETIYAERGSGVRTVITPKVRGVAIICEGGGDIVVKQKIVELVSRVLGIGTNKISVTN